MIISLRAGEKIYINGAVLKVDRKVSIELLNDVTFLLESHVLQADDAKTPLRQLYFYVQLMLMDPQSGQAMRLLVEDMLKELRTTFSNEVVLANLGTVDELMSSGHAFEALRTIRSMFTLEADIMSGKGDSPTKAA